MASESDREVRIGAAARRHARRQITVGVVGAALILGAVMLYRAARPEGSSIRTDTCPVRVRCGHCGYTTTLQLPVGQRFPIKCPQCGARACEPVWQCRACGAEFVPAPGDEPVHCPKCGSSRVGSAAGGGG